MKKYEPKIITFLCKWCTYVGADLAGTSRLKFSQNAVPIWVMCSDRVDSSFVFDAFAKALMEFLQAIAILVTINMLRAIIKHSEG